MEAAIINYRGSPKNRHKSGGNHIILKIKTVNTKADAHKLIKKKVIWTSPAGKKIVGEVAKEHGNSGAVRAIFEKGLPGQALGGKVEVQ